MVSAYLDTNIYILGESLPEFNRLHEIEVHHKVEYFISQNVYVEHRGRSQRLRKIEIGLRQLAGENLTEDQKRVLWEISDLHETTWNREDIEEVPWSKFHLRLTSSTFEVLYSIAFSYPDRLFEADTKGELGLRDELIEKYNIKLKDADHLMIAHSAGIDYFLSLDKGLIKKAAEVRWLTTRALMPSAFIDEIGE